MGISLDTARKLKDAGLKWEPETCDTYYWPRKFNNPVQVMHRDFDLLQKEQDTKGIVWAPRLSQLLAEIERREYVWNLRGYTDEDGRRTCWADLELGYVHKNFGLEDTPEEAVAQALLWILGRNSND